MAEPTYLTLSDLVAVLPTGTALPRTESDAFRVVMQEEDPFVEPLLVPYLVERSAHVTFVSARGASGKSTLATHLSRVLDIPLWSLGIDKAVSADTLPARLSTFLAEADPMAAVRDGAVPGLIVDGVDEARLRVTGLSWDQFIQSLVDFTAAGTHMIVLGRKRTIDDVWDSFAEADLSIQWFEISHFDQEHQAQYADLRSTGDNAGARTPAYVEARNVVLHELNGTHDAIFDHTFAGYAPVLDAVAALLKPPTNYQTIVNTFSSSGGASRLDIVRQILTTLLDREQTKIEPLATQMDLDTNLAFTPDEQLDWLASELLGGPQPSLGWCPADKRTEYVNQLMPFLADHPYRDGAGWASPVFSSFVAFKRFENADMTVVQRVADASGLLFEFQAANNARGGELEVDEDQFAALYRSLIAGQSESSTSIASLRGMASADAEIDTVQAQLSLLRLNGPGAVLHAEVVLSVSSTLHLTSPLANLDVDFPGKIVVASMSASIDLGPDVFLRAEAIELFGASLQISKATSSSDPSGPTVEIEATNSFESSATLVTPVSPSDLSIAVPQESRLVFPWVQYRSELPESELIDGPDDRVRRLLNKMMSLLRRHGHAGAPAVYVKKFEGRQPLPIEQFQRALEILIARGVVTLDNDLVFLRPEWEPYRFDGKGRSGMPSYEDKRLAWDPILAEISAAIA